MKWFDKLFKWLFPPKDIKRKRNCGCCADEPTNEDLDKWATAWLEKREIERRTKRGNKN